ncbi:unnamed protein product [Clavelina lepadiformis]|uniref:Fibrinogen C-terminal domain-containing protein n=1 Tax=Clavelina lepadiformis TaxID=159417 RepID=A0ABP0G4T7_CLALP
MRGVILLLSLACFVMMTYSVERRQVLTTDCDDDIINSTMLKGDKGDVGRPGKSGLSGVKGEPGGIGQKGDARRIVRYVVARDRHSHQTSNNGPHTLTSGVEVYCEDEWTIFQRRIDGSVDFGRRWDDYANGFGQIDGEFWLGLDNIHEMTRGGGCRLKIELWDFAGNQRHAEYSSFSIESAENLYRLRVSGYSGNAGDSLAHSNGYPFSTEDRDNDSSYEEVVERAKGLSSSNGRTSWVRDELYGRLQLPYEWGRHFAHQSPRSKTVRFHNEDAATTSRIAFNGHRQDHLTSFDCQMFLGRSFNELSQAEEDSRITRILG